MHIICVHRHRNYRMSPSFLKKMTWWRKSCYCCWACKKSCFFQYLMMMEYSCCFLLSKKNCHFSMCVCLYLKKTGSKYRNLNGSM